MCSSVTKTPLTEAGSETLSSKVNTQVTMAVRLEGSPHSSSGRAEIKFWKAQSVEVRKEIADLEK